jgi:Uncharacterised nucleotidyltransferase
VSRPEDGERAPSESSMAPSVDRLSFVKSVLAKETLRDTARVLHSRGIPLVPLKGVLFQLVLYAEPAQRWLTDVDVLVRERDFGAAIRALRGAGFEAPRASRSAIEVALVSPRGMTVDLHHRLFSRGRYRLPTDAVFARAVRDEALLGVPLQLAHPYDTAAHLIGKYVSDHVLEEREARASELLRWLQHCQLDPVGLAAHLHAHGLARAARYTLGIGAELLGAACFREVLAALPRDAVGGVCVRAARRLIPRWQGTALAAAPAHLLNASLPGALVSATWAGVARWSGRCPSF